MTSTAAIASVPAKSRFFPETAESILQTYDDFASKLNDPDWLMAMRQVGLDYVRTHGLPTPKIEGWKFTNLIPLVKNFGAQHGRTKVSSNKVKDVHVQGLTSSILEHDWVRKLMTEDAHYTDSNTDPTLWHLCNVFFRDGVSIDVPANTHADEPLRIVMECDDGMFYMVHTAIRIGANSSLTIIEDHCGQGNFWKNRLSHIMLEPGAKLTHVRIQRDSEGAVYTQNTKVSVAKDACYNAVAMYTGAALSRNQVHVTLNEPGASCHLNGAALMRGAQHADTTILVEHRAPHCQSNQNMRSVLDDRAHGVFQGKVHVYQPAQKTDGYQLSKAILLSEGAEMDTKPELEIYADDVKCSHGATTGQMDQEPLFYMQSRGIPEGEARALLIQSFIGDILNTVEDDEALHSQLMDHVRAWLAR